MIEQQYIPTTPIPQRRVVDINTLVLEIDRERRMKRESAIRSNRPTCNGKRMDSPSSVMEDRFLNPNKRQCVGRPLYPILQDGEKENEIILYNLERRNRILKPVSSTSDRGFSLRPRNLDAEFNESFRWGRKDSDIPFMPF